MPKKRFTDKIHGQVNNLFDKWDHFGIPVLSFTIDGKKTIGTSMGFICSIAFWVIVSMYSITRGIQLKDRKNPQISEITVENYYDHTDNFDF